MQHIPIIYTVYFWYLLLGIFWYSDLKYFCSMFVRISLLASKRALYLVEHSIQKGRKLMLSQAKHKLISLWYFLSIFWLFFGIKQSFAKHTREKCSLQSMEEWQSLYGLNFAVASIEFSSFIRRCTHTHVCTDRRRRGRGKCGAPVRQAELRNLLSSPHSQSTMTMTRTLKQTPGWAPNATDSCSVRVW